MFSWSFKKKKEKKPAFTCKECGFTCRECEAGPLCYICYSGRDTFCQNCKSKVVVIKLDKSV